MTFDDDIKACAELVQRADPERFQAAMAAPVAARLKLFVLYAFNAELARAPWASQESMIAEMRLQWWRDVGAEIAAGQNPRRHFVATPLAQILSPHSAQVIDAMAESRRWDIYREPFADDAALVNYLDQTAGGLMWMSAASLGPASETAARRLGFAHGVANWLRAIPALETHKRIPLLDGTAAGIRRLATHGLDALADARTRRRDISASAAPACLAAWQTAGLLRQAINEPDRVAAGELALSEFQKRLGLLWRSSTGRW